MQDKYTPTKSISLSLEKWLPFLVWSRGITKNTLLDDLLAGLTGAIVVLPQGVAYALIAGLPPEYGLYTAIITPVIAGLFGSSLHLISGPTAAISIVVLSVVSSVVPPDSASFISTVLTLTLLAGVIQLLFGFAKLGSLVNFISHTVVIGFTAGAAILIATSQLKYVIGAVIPSGSSFISTWESLFSQLNDFNTYSVLITLATIIVTLITKWINRRLPAMLIGMIAGSLICWITSGEDNGVALVGDLSGSLPQLSIPNLSFDTISAILPGAFAVAILGLVEAVSIARAIAINSGQRIEGNQEFIGQGLSNIVGSFFSCYAGSGSFTRTGINYESGAKTPLSAVFAALILVLIIVFFPFITGLLPLPAMAGAILLIAWGLIDKVHIEQILKSNRQEASIFLVTFLSTLIVELEFAIYLGVITSLILYLRRTSAPTVMHVAPLSVDGETELRSVERFNLPTAPHLKILRIDGSVFFGSVTHIQKQIQVFTDQHSDLEVLVINGSGINFIDLAGAEMLHQEIKRLNSKAIEVRFCLLKNTVLDEINKNGLSDLLKSDLFQASVNEALKEIQAFAPEKPLVH